MSLADMAQGYLDGRLSRDQRTTRSHVPVLLVLARLAGARIPPWRTARRAVLTMGGLGGLDYAVWDGAGRVWGVVAISLSLLLLEYLTSEDRSRR